MNEIDHKILFDLLSELTNDARFVICGDTFDPFNTDENIEKIVSEIDKKFIVKLREHY